jgi:phosphatidylcholine synthase
MSGFARAAAWAVHAYTASGAVLALLALEATLAGDYRRAFAWLAAQVAVDATDGWLARAARVQERTPEIVGAHLDDLVDYLCYVLVPAVMVWHAPMVPPALRLIVPAAMLVSSAFGFSRADAKTADHYFTGFPSYWNIVVLYFVIWQTGAWVNAVVLLGLAALVFVPIRYVYPSRTEVLMGPTIALGSSWAVAILLTLWWMPDVPAWLRWVGLAFPIYYVVLSLWLERGRRRS